MYPEGNTSSPSQADPHIDTCAWGPTDMQALH